MDDVNSPDALVHDTVLPMHENIKTLPNPSSLYQINDWVTIKDLYKSAEDAISTVEYQVGEGVDVAVNQLRYAGHHILEALTTGDANIEQEEMRKAARHCMRSIYDSCSWGIMTFNDNMLEFNKDYRLIVISEVLPDYLERLKKCKKAMECIQAARVDNAQRYKFFKIAAEHYDILYECTSDLSMIREDLNKKVKQQLRNRFYMEAGFILAVIAIILTLALA